MSEATSDATGVPAYRLANVFGYGHQLGLHEVDRTTFERTPKPSAGVYAALVRSHRPG